MILLKKTDYDKKAVEVYDICKSIMRAEINQQSTNSLYKSLRDLLFYIIDEPENKDYITFFNLDKINYDLLCKHVVFNNIKDYGSLRKVAFTSMIVD